MADFPVILQNLLNAVQMSPPLPSRQNPGVPIDLGLSHDKSSFDALQRIRDLGTFTLNVGKVALPGVGLDPSRQTLSVDLSQIDLGQIASNLELSLGQLNLSGIGSDVDLNLVSRSAQVQPAFTTALTALSVIGAASIATAARPAVGAVVEIGSPPSAELRTVTAVTGNGPFTVALSAPLALPHALNSPVTQRESVAPADLDPDQPAALITETFGLGTRITGVLGRLVGKVQQFTTAVLSQAEGQPGRIRGTLGPQPAAASIKLPWLKQIGETVGQVVTSVSQSVLPEGVVPTVDVRWKITDAAGIELTGPPYIAVTAGQLSGSLGQAVPPTIAFLPEFVGLGAPGTSVRNVSCTLTLKAEGYRDLPKTLGPVSIEVPQVPFPTVLVMTEHSPDDSRFPGAVLVAVPGSYPSWDWRTLTAFLGAARHLLQPVLVLPGGLGAPYVELDTAIARVLHLLEVQPTPTSFYRSNEVLDLYWETRAPGWPENWQDDISSIVFLGLPGRAVSLHNRPNLWSGTGAFRITVGALPAAILDSLWFRHSSDSSEPDKATVVPATSRIDVDELPTSGSPFHNPTTFNDVISSFQFLPQAPTVP